VIYGGVVASKYCLGFLQSKGVIPIYGIIWQNGIQLFGMLTSEA